MSCQPYNIGDLVDAVEFTDCFGKFHPRRCGLVVETVKLERGVSIGDYWRIKAVSPDPRSNFYVEGAADLYFAPADGAVPGVVPAPLTRKN